MSYSLATLDRLTQKFVRSGTSLFIRTYDNATLVHEFEFTDLVPGAPVPVEVSEVARSIRVDIARGVPTTSTDAYGNTVLVGGAGTIMPMLGANTITVGAGGMYATIAEALASVSLAEMFVPITMTSAPANALSWDKGTKEIFTSAAAIINILADGHYENLWVKLSGDTRLYPVQSINGWGDAGSTGDSIITKVARIETSFSGTNALTFYRATPVKILLLDKYHEEFVTITTPVCVDITSACGTVWSQPVTEVGGSTVGYSGEYGHIKVGPDIHLAYGFATENTSPDAWVIEFVRNKQTAQTSDFHSFTGTGLVIFRDNELHASPIGGLGHFVLTSNNPGNLEIYGGTFTVHVNRNASAKGSALPFDSVAVDRFICSGTKIIIDDYSDNLTLFSLLALKPTQNTSLAGNVGPEVHLSDITVESLYPSTATIVLADENNDGVNSDNTMRTDKVSLVNCHIAQTNLSGAKHLYRTSTGGSGRVVEFQACSGGLIGSPSVGSRTGTALVV